MNGVSMGLQKVLGLGVLPKSGEIEPMNTASWSYIRSRSMRLTGPDASFTDTNSTFALGLKARLDEPPSRLHGGFDILAG